MSHFTILGYLLGKHTPSGTPTVDAISSPRRPQATAPHSPSGAVADSSDRLNGLLHALAPVDVRWDWPAKGRD